jgi:hypothetical protein
MGSVFAGESTVAFLAGAGGFITPLSDTFFLIKLSKLLGAAIAALRVLGSGFSGVESSVLLVEGSLATDTSLEDVVFVETVAFRIIAVAFR